MNIRNFNDCEKRSSNLQLCFLKSFFKWISVNVILDVSNFVEFCGHFVGRCSFVYFYYTWVALLALSINLIYVLYRYHYEHLR
jgi:hypothetical protein